MTIHLLSKGVSKLKTLTYFALAPFYLFILSCLDNNNPKLHVDFDAFYQSSQALNQSLNPYLSGNFNPPIFQLLFKPFSYLSPHYSFLAWGALMGLCYFFSIKLTLSLFVKKNIYGGFICLGLVASFPFIKSLLIGQITGLIFFLIIAGYHALTLKKNVLTGLLWGLATSLKFFPGLIVFVLIKQKKHRTFLYFSLCTFIFITLPLLFYPLKIYTYYIKSMSHIKWFSHSWNNSLFSLPFKFFLYRESTISDMIDLKNVGYALSFTGLTIYLSILFKKKLSTERQFMLSICFMLLISPLAWLYYLPMTFIPICFMLSHFNKMDSKQQQCLLISILFICLPITNDFLPAANHSNLFILLFYCLPTLGLILLAGLTSHSNRMRSSSDKRSLLVDLLIVALLLTFLYSSLTFVIYLLKTLISSSF